MPVVDITFLFVVFLVITWQYWWSDGTPFLPGTRREWKQQQQWRSAVSVFVGTVARKATYNESVNSLSEATIPWRNFLRFHFECFGRFARETRKARRATGFNRFQRLVFRHASIASMGPSWTAADAGYVRPILVTEVQDVFQTRLGVRQTVDIKHRCKHYVVSHSMIAITEQSIFRVSID